MKMNYVHWVRRVLACMAIFCLTASFGTQPAQASPPAGKNLIFNVKFIDKPKTVCQDPVTIKVEVSVTKVFETKPVRTRGPFKGGSIQIRTSDGFLEPTDKKIDPLWLGKENAQIYEIVYTPLDLKGKKTVRINVTGSMPSVGFEMTGLDLEVTCKWSVHGTTNMNEWLHQQGTMLAWEPVGPYYDISGTLEADENGSLHGQATANLFYHVFWTGEGADDITCKHLNPWEGNTTIEIEADPNAWANENALDLKFKFQPMQTNSTQVFCQTSTGGGVGPEMPSITVASFDLDFDPLPTSGGSTSLDFHFPGGQVELEMYLIVSPQEADS